VLLIGLTNAATLLTVRAARRRHESAIRLALGASRRRLLAVVAGEALAVGLVASTASLLAAWWLDEVVRQVLMPGIVPSDGIPARVAIAAALGGLLLAAVGFAAMAAQVPAPGRARDLQTARGSGLERVLLVVQTAVSVILLAGAAMFGRSLYALTTQDLGMAVEELLVAEFEPGLNSPPDSDELLTAALPRVRELRGVVSATVYQALPFNGFHVPPIAVPGRAEPPSVGQQLPFLIAATPELHDVMGIRIVDGRGFDATDEQGAPVVIVNEAMARSVWPGERAVGQCIRIGFDPDFDPATAGGPPTPSAAVPCREVIGVAHDVRQRSIVPTNNESALMQYYVPFTQVPMPPFAVAAGPRARGIVIRVARSADRSALSGSIAALLVNGRTDLPPARVRRFADIFERQLRPWRLGWSLLAIFSTLAVAMSAIGLYAAFAHAVAQRRREMAIRLAIGASPRQVGAKVVRDAVMLSLAGLGIGSVVAVVAGRSIGAWLYGIEPLDPLVLGPTMLLMMTVCIGATLLPARSAAMSDPNALLRAD
jgi:predicted permease